jgi:hypothetical protein
MFAYLSYSPFVRSIKKLLWYPAKRCLYRRAVNRVQAGETTAVLVYQMGKVASKSVALSVAQYRRFSVFHLHILSPSNYVEAEEQQRILLGDNDVSYVLDASRIVYDGLIATGLPMKIVTLVREPIGRNISAYFQNLDFWWKTPDAHRKIPMPDLVDRFLEDFHHDVPLTWFDKEFRPATGIDVYSLPFPQEQGFQKFHADHLDVLVLRHDLDDCIKASRLGELLGVGDFRLLRENTAEGKRYREKYKEFQSSLRLSSSYVDDMLGSKYARHFFSREELAQIRERWLGNRPAGRAQ